MSGLFCFSGPLRMGVFRGEMLGKVRWRGRQPRHSTNRRLRTVLCLGDWMHRWIGQAQVLLKSLHPEYRSILQTVDHTAHFRETAKSANERIPGNVAFFDVRQDDVTVVGAKRDRSV